MTGGVVAVLGKVGDNFGAGMHGGMAFVYDPEGAFGQAVNADTVVWQKLRSAHWEGVLKELVAAHVRETQSAFAAGLLADWERALPRFVQVCPKEMLGRLEHPLGEEAVAATA
jgi:glutamate synthase (NADPH/NADH) large chain